MNLKIATLLLAAFYMLEENQIDAHRNPGGAVRAPGGQRSLPQGGQQGRGRPFDGPGGNGRPGFPGGDMVESIDLTCGQEFDCQLPNGEAGSFICRTRYNPILGDSQSRARCMPVDSAKTGDECGCCGGECPEKPEFTELGCDNSDLLPEGFGQGGNEGGKGRRGLPPGIPGVGDRFDDVEISVVCRDLVNPFTGESQPVTIPVPDILGREGDECGCCDGNCTRAGPRFERPDQVTKTCDAAEEVLIPCNITRGRGMGGGQAISRSGGGIGGNVIEGIFVCRELFNPRTGNNESEALCIPPDRAWDTDECGCCGGECPEKPAPVDIECDDTCALRNGALGVFVCRSMFHPITGDEAERSMCIPSNRAWVTDQCSCCDSVCPATPEGGFGDEDTQLLSLALGTEEFVEADDGNEPGASSAFGGESKLAGLVLSGIATIAAFMN